MYKAQKIHKVIKIISYHFRRENVVTMTAITTTLTATITTRAMIMMVLVDPGLGGTEDGAPSIAGV